jgi:hypothetical protein
MDDTICYLNTDLVLIATTDPGALVAAFRHGSVHALYPPECSETLWYVSFETDLRCDEPETSIDVMLKAVEAFGEPARTIWASCTQREFNIGYDCGNTPWAFNQALSSELTARIAAAGASLRITLYPPHGKEMA